MLLVEDDCGKGTTSYELKGGELAGTVRSVEKDEDGRIVEDVLCTGGRSRNWGRTGCRYNLRSQKKDGRCPECGQAVVLSLIHEDLHWADAGWVRTLAWGAWILLVALPLTIVLVALMFRGDIRMMWAALLAVIAVGVWMFTSAQPGKVPTSRKRWLRLICRASAILLLLHIAGTTSMQFGVMLYPRAWTNSMHLMTWAVLVFACAATTMLIAREHARLLGMPDVAGALRTAGIATLILGPLSLIALNLSFSDIGRTVFIFCGALLTLAFGAALFQLAMLAPQLWRASNEH